MSVGDRTATSRLPVFFLLTYAVMWAAFFTVVARRIPAGSPGGILLLHVGAFAPSLVALALTARDEGGAGVRALLGRAVRWRVPWRWYAFAVAFVPAVELTSALAHRLLAGAWPAWGNDPWYLIPLAVVVSTPFQAGEEIGWRGYALPRLADRVGLRAGGVVLGLLWAFWHVPQFFIPEADTFGQSFAVYALQVTALSVILAWLWARAGGSLVPVMLLHAAVNNAGDIVPSAVSDHNPAVALGASLVAWLTAAVLWISAVYLLTRMPRSP